MSWSTRESDNIRDTKSSKIEKGVKMQ